MSITAAIDANEHAIGEQPAKAHVTFKAAGALVGPTEVDVTARGHRLKIDEPEVLGGANAAANPVEYALAALASCQAITYRYWAAELGIQLDGVTVTVDADFDMGAFFGFPGAGTPAPSAVRCSVVLDGPEPPDRYDELVAAVDAHCPVLDLFSRPVPVERSVTKR